MTAIATIPEAISEVPQAVRLPDHLQLPESDGKMVENFQEHPQSLLLTDSIQPVLRRTYPDGQYCIGQNSGIYWRITDPPLNGCRAPDWFFVPGVPPVLDGRIRRSYVMWQEIKAPLIALEFASGDGSEERDSTPWTGKFWIYEQAIRIPFYGIFHFESGRIEAFHLIEGRYQPMRPNERGHFPFPPLGVELGVWIGRFLMNLELPWLRWWDAQGNLLPTGEEKAEQEQQRSQRLAERLRALGVDPESP